jgi:hypothetical protein
MRALVASAPEVTHIKRTRTELIRGIVARILTRFTFRAIHHLRKPSLITIEVLMSTQVRSYSKINLGLVIGPVRPDGFHGLTTLYQTLQLHDLVTVEAARLPDAKPTSIRIACNHPGVPTDARNTAWRMVEKALTVLTRSLPKCTSTSTSDCPCREGSVLARPTRWPL